MSASPMARQSLSQNIPIRKVQLAHAHELPSDYSTTPGGTIFSTTPGGTRIVYTGNFLKTLRNSPLAKTPPATLAHIPGVTKNASGESSNFLTVPGSGSPPSAPPSAEKQPAKPAAGEKPPQHPAGQDEEPQFDMDM